MPPAAALIPPRRKVTGIRRGFGSRRLNSCNDNRKTARMQRGFGIFEKVRLIIEKTLYFFRGRVYNIYC